MYVGHIHRVVSGVFAHSGRDSGVGAGGQCGQAGDCAGVAATPAGRADRRVRQILGSAGGAGRHGGLGCAQDNCCGGATNMSQADTKQVEELSAQERAALVAGRGVFLERMAQMTPIWVFAYGSLLWNPGFDFAERLHARVTGWRRNFCLLSNRYRGTPQQPGLVLALDKGGVCDGIVYRLPDAERQSILAYLWDREMITGAYCPITVRARTCAGAKSAISFAINRDHRQYAGALGVREKVKLIARGYGENGPNRDYVFSTAAYLRAIAVECEEVNSIAAALQAGDSIDNCAEDTFG